MQAVVNTLATLGTFPFRNAAGALVTGKTNSDFTKRVLKDGAVSAVVATVTEVSTLSGYYSTSLTPTATGTWTLIVEYTADPTFAWSESFTVIPAAADPSALATAIANVQTDVTTIKSNVDVAVSTRASAAVWTSARASKVDRIGSAAAIVTAGSLTDGGRLELRRNDSYLAADGNAKTWAYSGPAIASATLTLRTFAGVTALQVPVTLAEETLSADLTAVQTAALALGTPRYRYEIEAIFSGGGTSTLVSGDVWVKD